MSIAAFSVTISIAATLIAEAKRIYASVDVKPMLLSKLKPFVNLIFASSDFQVTPKTSEVLRIN